jgi:diacylglycerol O-acyltransferase
MTTPGIPSTNEEAWELASHWGEGRYMSPFEALMWRIEQDPRLRSTMTVVYLLDSAPDWDRLVAAHEWASRLIPRIRQRVVEPPLGLGTPTWVADDEFDLGFHVRRLRLPQPGTLRQLLDLVQGDAMASFDRSRPPWRASLVEGLEDGRTAYVLKLHHSMTDGQGGTQLLGLLHSRTREPSPDKPLPDPPAPENASPVSILAQQATRALGSAPGDALHAATGIASTAARIASSPIEGVEGAARFGRSLQRILAPPPVEPSPLLSPRSRSWRFDALAVSLPDLKAAGKAAGGSLNDAYVSALLGGFRRYHEHFDRPIEEMPMAMPISLRRGDHPMGGNRFAGARFAAPVGEPDPAERIRAVHEFVLTARDEPALDVFGLLAPALNRLPMALVARGYGAQTTKLDLQASNVAGLPYDAYIAGARIEQMLPFGPLPGCAVMATLLSYAGTCCIGLNTDPAAVTEPDVFVHCLEEGLDEVLTLGSAGGNGRSASAGGRRLMTL